MPQHNLLIRVENLSDADGDGRVDVPDDHVGGATFVFTLDTPWCVTSMDLIDNDEPAIGVALAAADSTTLAVLSASALGDNSREHLQIGVCGVSTVTVSLTSSGAVDDLVLCEE